MGIEDLTRSTDDGLSATVLQIVKQARAIRDSVQINVEMIDRAVFANQYGLTPQQVLDGLGNKGNGLLPFLEALRDTVNVLGGKHRPDGRYEPIALSLPEGMTITAQPDGTAKYEPKK